MWRMTPGARRCYRPGWMTGVWTVERYMETSESLEQKGTPEGSTLLVAVSPANHIVTQDQEKGPKIPEICGPTHGMSFGWWDPSGSCLRTYQASFLEMMDGKALGSVYLESFPNWGLMVSGEFIAQPMQEPRISDGAGGSWPTPRASADHYGRPRFHDGGDLQAAALWPTPVGDGDRTTNYAQGGTSLGFAARNPEMWATPNTFDAVDAKSQEALDHEHESARPGRSNPNNLRDQIAVSEGTRFWATPTGEDAKNTAGPGREKRHGPMLNLQVTKWPTPTGDDANNVTRASGDFQSLSREVEGSLNPDWVEQHLMSLPEGWTRLEPVPEGAYDEWFDAMRDGTWWDTERGLPRVTTGAENRVNRLKMLGNGIVPATLALFLTNGKKG